MSYEYFQQLPPELPPSQCPENVTDEYSSEVPLELSSIMAKFQSEGVDVRVFNVASMKEEDFNTNDSMSIEAFFDVWDEMIDQLYDKCDISAENSIVLIRVEQDRYIEIYTSGKQEEFNERNPQFFENMIDEYLDLARDGGPETLDDDAALILGRIYDKQFASQAEVEVPTQTPEAETEQTPVVAVPPKETDNNLDVPAAEIGLGVWAIAVIGSFGFVGKKRSAAKNTIREFKAATEQNEAEVERVVSAGELEAVEGELNLLAVVPEDDIPEITDISAEILEGLEYFEESGAAADFDLAGIGRKIVPNSKRMKSRIAEYNTEVAPILDLVAQFDKEVTKLKQEYSEIDELLSRVSGDIMTVDEEMKLLTRPSEIGEEHQPYTIASLESLIMDIKTRQVEALAMRDEFAVRGSTELARANADELTQLQETVVSLPEEHDALSQRYRDQLEARFTAVEQIAEVENYLEVLTAEYHADFSAQVRGWLQSLRHASLTLDQAVEAQVSPVDVYDYDQLLVLSQEIESLEGQLAQQNGFYQGVQEYRSSIKEASQVCPTELGELQNEYQHMHDYVANYADYIEEDTQAELSSARESINALSIALSSEKPQFLDLRSDITSSKAVNLAIFEQVKLEHQEVLGLISDVQDNISAYNQELSSVRSSYGNHSDVDSSTEDMILQRTQLAAISVEPPFDREGLKIKLRSIASEQEALTALRVSAADQITSAKAERKRIQDRKDRIEQQKRDDARRKRNERSRDRARSKPKTRNRRRG